MKMLAIVVLVWCTLQEISCDQSQDYVPNDDYLIPADILLLKINMSLRSLRYELLIWIEEVQVKVQSLVDDLKQLIERLQINFVAIRNQVKIKVEKLKNDFTESMNELHVNHEKVSKCRNARKDKFEEILEGYLASEEICLGIREEKLNFIVNMILSEIQEINGTINAVNQFVDICLEKSICNQITCLVAKVRDIQKLAELNLKGQMHLANKVYYEVQDSHVVYSQCEGKVLAEIGADIQDLVADVKKCVAE